MVVVVVVVWFGWLWCFFNPGGLDVLEAAVAHGSIVTRFSRKLPANTDIPYPRHLERGFGLFHHPKHKANSERTAKPTPKAHIHNHIPVHAPGGCACHGGLRQQKEVPSNFFRLFRIRGCITGDSCFGSTTTRQHDHGASARRTGRPLFAARRKAEDPRPEHGPGTPLLGQQPPRLPLDCSSVAAV